MKRKFLIALLVLSGCSNSVTSNSDKIIFVTSAGFTGNLGGVSGADSKCSSDANKPNGNI
jgi:hypothetical protein